MRLDKYLADMGLGTRSELKKAIRGGVAQINGVVEKDPGASVSSEDHILWYGEPVAYESSVYYMLNKPTGTVSATEDRVHKTVIDLIYEYEESTDNAHVTVRKDLFPVGRLDIDTEGLLIITNDGDLAHRLLSPKHHVNKMYFARLDNPVTQEDVELFVNGFRVDEELTAMPSKLEILKDNKEAFITIQEGKFHQVKRMFEAVGKEVQYLKRISMGPIVLDDSLHVGECRRLTEEEINLLKNV